MFPLNNYFRKTGRWKPALLRKPLAKVFARPSTEVWENQLIKHNKFKYLKNKNSLKKLMPPAWIPVPKKGEVTKTDLRAARFTAFWPHICVCNSVTTLDRMKAWKNLIFGSIDRCLPFWILQTSDLPISNSAQEPHNLPGGENSLTM